MRVGSSDEQQEGIYSLYYTVALDTTWRLIYPTCVDSFSIKILMEMKRAEDSCRTVPHTSAVGQYTIV